MAWWRDARFGMFIHWGLYAVPAGTWHGERVDGLGEWIMARAHIPGRRIRSSSRRQFNPVQFDAERGCASAKDAGMKYIIITSKHHDGFAQLRLEGLGYDIVDATPYHRDAHQGARQRRAPRGAFASASTTRSWIGITRMRRRRRTRTTTRATRDYPELRALRRDVHEAAVRELVTQYPEIDVLWFDGEWVADWSDEQGRRSTTGCTRCVPSLIINNRVGHSRQGMAGMSANKDAPGDFGTPEQQVPPAGASRRGLGDVHDAQRHVGLPVVRRRLEGHPHARAYAGRRRVEGRQPPAQRRTDRAGVIPAQSVSRLREMGDWMRANGESIYGTVASRTACRHGGATRRAGRESTRTSSTGPRAGSSRSPA